MNKTERLLYGRKEGQPEYMEDLLLSNASAAMIHAVKAIAAKDGYTMFREAVVDLTVVPDFVGAINQGRG